MTTEVVAIEPEMSLRGVIEILRSENVSGVPVVTTGRVVGVISATDLLEFEATTPGVPGERPNQAEWGEIKVPESWDEGLETAASFFTEFWADVGADVFARFEEAGTPEWDLLREHTAAEVMTQVLYALPPDAEIHAAAEYMTDSGIHRILVMKDQELVGIVTATDIVRAVAERRV
jgi:CBS domain-containing protein